MGSLLSKKRCVPRLFLEFEPLFMLKNWPRNARAFSFSADAFFGRDFLIALVHGKRGKFEIWRTRAFFLIHAFLLFFFFFAPTDHAYFCHSGMHALLGGGIHSRVRRRRLSPPSFTIAQHRFWHLVIHLSPSGKTNINMKRYTFSCIVCLST